MVSALGGCELKDRTKVHSADNYARIRWLGKGNGDRNMRFCEWMK